jgi:hypothetical protein
MVVGIPTRTKTGVMIMTMALVKEYDTHLDSKNRITLRGATAGYYAVQVFDSGTVLLEPRVLTHPANLPPKTLRMMDKAVGNFKKRKVSPAIDLKKYLGKAARP